MNLPLYYGPEVGNDVQAAVAWYDNSSIKLGNRFRQALRNALDRVSQNPEGFGIVKGVTRACKVKKFPYVIYFTVESVRIVIVAVVHGSRDSSSWEQRV